METAKAPFVTENVKLAFALYSAGIPLAMIKNTYTAAHLRTLGFTGLPIEEATRQAHQRGHAGKVAYSFEKTPQLAEIVKAFDEAQKVADSKEDYDFSKLALGVFENVQSGALTPNEGIAKIICYAMDARREFLKLWKNVVPQIHIKKEGDPTTRDGANGAKIVSHPGFIEYSLNASPEIKRHLGVGA